MGCGGAWTLLYSSLLNLGGNVLQELKVGESGLGPVFNHLLGDKMIAAASLSNGWGRVGLRENW